MCEFAFGAAIGVLITGEKENLTAGLIGADGQAGGLWVVAGSERCRPCEQLEGYPPPSVLAP
jgi:hypothetical protein